MSEKRMWERGFKVFALIVALLSIPQLLRGEFIIEWSLGGVLFATTQWMAFALAILLVFDFVRRGIDEGE